jgi:flagellar hook-length control protein FliK
LTAAPAAAVPAAAAPQAGPDAPAPPADAPPAPPAAAPQAAEAQPAPVPAQPQPQTTDASGKDAAAQQVAIPAAPQPATATATTQATPPQPAETETAAVAAPKPPSATATDEAKPGARKPQAGKDTGKDKSDEAQPTVARRDTQAFDIAFAAAPKAQPQPQAQVTPDTGLAVHGLSTAGTQTASAPAALPQLLQQAQVTAEPPKPNLPVLAVEIAARTQSGARQFDIRLDPPELGRVEVRLSIDATGKASAHLSADQPQTLDLLQKDAPMLARALRDAGLDVAQDGLNFSLRQQAQNQGQNGGAPRGLGRTQRLSAVATIESAPAAVSYRANGRLDIRV